MTYAVRSTDVARYVAPRRRATASRMKTTRPGLLARLFGAFRAAREREAERIAAAHLARTGFRFTDSIERDLNDRLLGGGGWNARS